MRAIVSLLLTFTMLVAIAACSSKEQLPAAVPQAGPTPHQITDLSSLGPDQPNSALTFNPALTGNFAKPAATADVEALRSSQNELSRLFLSNPGKGKFAGTASAPGELRLTNAKAARFGAFSNMLLNQLFVATQQLEARKLSSTVLSENLLPAVISARMDPSGQLRELIVEQHSGSGAVDQLMIEACKKGLWAVNPPKQALGADGMYHLRIEARLKDFNRTTQANRWNFDTRLGLGLE